jgi:hypothetical protein
MTLYQRINRPCLYRFHKLCIRKSKNYVPRRAHETLNSTVIEKMELKNWVKILMKRQYSSLIDIRSTTLRCRRIMRRKLSEGDLVGRSQSMSLIL